ncbi:hypothetical protein DPM19_13975 [Actinomadura craniellae]|uniref:PASTA domain-containing protein n=1 Tax=Actinomadura craniellae TaxID=2231787 RepID=A0A365H732_9ACTN|nr:transglycosylase domain-containing protein [Actinomadura craniellae]RAY14828.1 hypothetical protein DPM19_13975 [Actinomadura craniellae]
MRVQSNAPGKTLVTLFRLVGAGVLAGVLVALIALPSVGTAGLTARDAADSFQNLDGELNTDPPPEKTVVYDSKGKTVATFFDKYRESVRLDQVAPVMKQAIIDIEDSRFYQHGAMDLKGTIRALATNAEAGETTQGGSTLTQQYVKNLLVENAKTDEEYRAVTAPTISRKLTELRYALDIEEKMTKDEILQGYMNIAYFGAGAYGVQAAAKRYFSVPAAKLSLGQAALLAGITKNPSAYDPIRFPKNARQRRDIVLHRMAELGHITKVQADAEAAKPVKLKETQPKGGCETSQAPFFCEYVKYEMYNMLGGGNYWKLNEKQRTDVRNRLNRGGYVIRTTLDMKAQRAADRALKNYLNPGDTKVAAEAMVEPGTGKIRAMAASKPFGPDKKTETSINLVADWKHGGGSGFQAGSTFKAFTLATALKEGMSPNTALNAPAPFMPNSGYTDCKGRTVNSPGHQVFNASGEGDKGGRYTLRTGTWQSANTFFMALEREVGLCDVTKTAAALGITRRSGGPELAITPTFTLGVNEMDPVTVAAAYAAFGARGKYCKPIALTEVTEPSGKKLKVPSADCKQALDEQTADGVNGILQGVFTRGTMKGVGGIGRPAAGKTGTTDGSAAAWFAGYTPDLAAAVSLGDPRGPNASKLTGQGACMGGRCYGTVYGATVPGPIWKQSMMGALEGKPATSFSAPPDYGDEPVPDVRGMPVDQAMNELRSAGFNPQLGGLVRSDEPLGRVARTSPGGGSEAEPGTTVRVFVSQARRGRGGGQIPGLPPGFTFPPGPGGRD